MFQTNIVVASTDTVEVLPTTATQAAIPFSAPAKLKAYQARRLRSLPSRYLAMPNVGIRPARRVLDRLLVVAAANTAVSRLYSPSL
jgi:hypothetical protein